MTMSTELFGVKIERNPSQEKLDELGVSTWPKSSYGPSKFRWTFSVPETIYMIAGKAKVKILEHNESFEVGIGDLVVFPRGMEVYVDVIEAAEKHYKR